MLERNHQVGLMGSVYSSSACAFIWLGPEDEGSDRALSLIDSLDDMLLENNGSLDEAEFWDLVNDTFSALDYQTCKELAAVFARPWFHRLWTFQEAILAPDRMIACGSKIQDWDTFLNAVDACLRCQGSEKFTATSICPFLDIQSFMDTKSEDLLLSDLIYSNWKREATDPRDKIYALYGLLQGYQVVPLEINYAMSVEDVYRSTVRFCIENEGKLFILNSASNFRKQSLHLPSWVPDWRHRFPLGRSVVCENSRDFRASSAARPLLVPSSSDDELILKGFNLSIVERTIDTAALRVGAANCFSDSWRTNAAAAGVPACFLQGATFQTSYDLTTTIECSPFHSSIGQRVGRILWPNSIRWITAGRPDPIPQTVLAEYKTIFDRGMINRCLFLTKDSLGLGPAPIQVGDRVCILLGGDAPFILRPRQKSGGTTPSKEAESEYQNMSSTTSQDTAHPAQHGSPGSPQAAKQALEATEWTLIGDCYLYGYMRGEAMETVTEADYMNFTLV